jgi:succinoglycan biosynthesis transport protein ExoP
MSPQHSSARYRPTASDPLTAPAPHWARGYRETAEAQPGPPAIDPAIASLLRDDEGDDLQWPARLAPGRLLRGVLLRWRWIVAALALGATFGILVALLAVDKHWEAGVTLIMQDQEEELSVGGGQPYQTRSYTLETLIDAIKLPTSLDETLKRSGVEAGRDQLAGAIDLSLAQKSDILNLRVAWTDPAQAAALANALADVFVERTGRIRREEADAAYRRYEAQLEDARRRVQEADAEILAFQLENQVTDFAEEIKARIIDLSRLQADYWTQVAEAEALGGAASDLSAFIETLPTEVTTTLYRNPLQKRLEEYEWQLKEARTRYTSENPKVIKLERQVDSLRALAAGSGPTGPEPIVSPNDLRRDLNVKLQDVRERSLVAAARAQGLETSIAQQSEKLSTLSALEKKFRQLESRQQTTRELERSLSSKMEEARVAMSAADPSLQIVERALVPYEPQPSGRKLVAIAACLLAIAAGLGLALLAELRDPLVRSLADVQDLAPEAVTWELEPGDTSSDAPVNAQDPLFRAYRRLAGDLARRKAHGDLGAGARATAGEGRSAVARGLAIALAVRGESSVLADADFRPEAGPRSVPRRGDGSGLAELVASEVTAAEVRQQDAVERLQSVACGGGDTDASGALLSLGQPAFQAALAALLPGSARVVIDLPPCGHDEGAFEAVVRCQAAVVVARWGVTRRDEVAALARRLQDHDVAVIGVVLVGVPAERRVRYAGASPLEILAGELRRLTKRPARRASHA